MAKKRTMKLRSGGTARKAVKKVAKSELVVPVPKLELSIGGNLDVSDVLSIVVTKAEQTYAARIKESQELIADAKKRRSDKQDEIAKKSKAFLREELKIDVAVLQKAVSAISSTKYVAKIGEISHNEEKVESAVVIRQSGERYDKFSIRVEMKQPADNRTLYKELAEIEKEVFDLTKEAVDWKRKMANVPMLERQYRAKIAEDRLAAAEGGQALLDLLTGDLEQDILNLPGV